MNKTYICTIYLKSGSTVTTTTDDPEGLICSLNKFMDSYYNRLWWRVNSTVRLIGTPTVCIPIEHINFYALQETPVCGSNQTQ